MVKSRIFDNTQLLKEHPELPHYKEEVVCFRSEYKTEVIRQMNVISIGNFI